jgi:hypothetical protein
MHGGIDRVQLFRPVQRERQNAAVALPQNGLVLVEVRHQTVIARQARKERSSFLKKEAKNFCAIAYAAYFEMAVCANEQKFFGSFFQKKNTSFFSFV